MNKKSSAHELWQRENTVHYHFKVMKRTESDIINKLDSVPNKSGYIKALIRADIAKNDD